MAPLSIIHPALIIILLATYTTKSTRAFSPSVVSERTSRLRVGQPKTICNRRFTKKSRRRNNCRTPIGSLIDTPCTSLNNGVNYHNGPSTSTKNASSRPSGIPSSTARESAVTAEWEPILELRRHHVEGENRYEHAGKFYSRGEDPMRSGRVHQNHGWGEDSDGVEVVNGVFCGYRFTEEECVRLRSANPEDFSM